ncbi:energy transducer TonB [Chromobacterium violaceum]|uniref:energy transducer TonB n=1 Tax=Chromobacterium violaceum TaxID=536 RepID=UPI00030354B4|nr:energy transducer TonB [Chromobacterium violaceum]
MVAVQPSGGGDALLNRDDRRWWRALLLSAAIHLSALAAWLALDGRATAPPADTAPLVLALRPAGSPSADRAAIRSDPARYGSPPPGRPAAAGGRRPGIGHPEAEKRRVGSPVPATPEWAGREWKTEPKDGVGPGGLAALTGGNRAGKTEGADTGALKGGGDSDASYAPAYLENPQPAYPERSRQLGEEGVVTLSVRAGVDGRVLAVTVARSSGFRRLDQAATDAVSRWRFVPAKRSGKPVESDWTVPVRFEVKGR